MESELMPVRINRRRYLAVELITKHQTLTKSEVNDLVNNKIMNIYGVKGLLEINYKLIEYDTEQNFVIFRCNHKFVRDLHAALSLINKINDHLIHFYVRKESGTLKSLQSTSAEKD
jgi:RNase P/RNase MRP subunit POP5